MFPRLNGLRTQEGVSRHRLGLSCIPRSFYYLALIPSRYVTRINIEILSTKKIAKKIRRSAEINQVIGQRLTPPLEYRNFNPFKEEKHTRKEMFFNIYNTPRNLNPYNTEINFLETKNT